MVMWGLVIGVCLVIVSAFYAAWANYKYFRTGYIRK
jgi:hypothetical protein